MNLLMTLDRNYVPQLNVMLFSALGSGVLNRAVRA